MYFILGNEYMRMWFKERAKYEKNIYKNLRMANAGKQVKRGYVVRSTKAKKTEDAAAPVVAKKKSAKKAKGKK